MPEVVSEFDVDGDGVVSWEEFVAVAKAVNQLQQGGVGTGCKLELTFRWAAPSRT